MIKKNCEKNRDLFSLNINPKAKLEDQLPGEEVVLLLRANPITQIWWILNFIALLAMLIFLNFFIHYVLDYRQIFFLNIFYISSIFTYGWINFLKWYYNIGIVTTERIIDVDLISILNRDETEVDLKQVTEVTSKIIGFLPSMFNFGNIYIRTFGIKQNVYFQNVSEPDNVASIINNLIRKNQINQHGANSN